MISSLQLQGIGPADDLRADFGSRLNVVTGDNGLGKTFLLDASWYVLTRTWADDRMILPDPDSLSDAPPRISYTTVGKSGREMEGRVAYDFASQNWKGASGRPPISGLVIYARIDGGFSVWDPARNHWRDGDEGHQRPSSYQFSRSDVWRGLSEADSAKIICNGLLRDVELWRLRRSAAFERLQKVLRHLSPDENEILSLGEGVRLRVDDALDIPTLLLPYARVPITMAAAGMRRVLSLAYLLVWAWEEHQRASELRKEEPTDRIVLLFDEVEAHLHPRWQRVFLPAVLEAVESLGSMRDPCSVQLITTTHASLVLGSVEAHWREAQDRLFDFDLREGRVIFTERPFARHGSAKTKPAA